MVHDACVSCSERFLGIGASCDTNEAWHRPCPFYALVTCACTLPFSNFWAILHPSHFWLKRRKDADTMSKTTINPEALRQFAVASDELLSLMRAVNLDGQSPSSEYKANESSSPPDSNSATQESFTTAPNSMEDSLEYSFGYLNITASQWEDIDRESEQAPEPEKPKFDSTKTEARPRPTRQASGASAKDTDLASSYLTKKTTLSDIKPAGEALGQVHIHTKYRFSPSVLAHHANTDCEKMLHLKGAELWVKTQQPKKTPQEQDATKDNSTPGTIAEAHQERGLEFEARLQQRIENKIDCEQEKDKDSFFRLATSEFGTTLCQPIFSLDDSFYTMEMAKAGIQFGRFIPDFIRIVAGSRRCDGTRRSKLFIIDAKSSLQVKISHQVMTKDYTSSFLWRFHHIPVLIVSLYSPSSSK